VPWLSAEVVLPMGVAPSFRRMDQLTVFSCHQPPCAAQGYSRRLRAAMDTAPSARMAGSCQHHGAGVASPCCR
jgi:hypothetical protein